MSSRAGAATSEGGPGPRRVLRHGPAHALVGESPAIDALRKAVRAVAAARATVLVTGETGTGKGLVARLIHDLSGASGFVHVDCASLAPTVIESELFGHERGAFTGAAERRVGRFERAGSGTVFLDEIADVESSLQAKLLRVLQDRAFERVGGGETLPLRARVIAATNRDLAADIDSGRFRSDLYYRLQVVELCIPPLRQRREDLPLLFEAACARLARATGRAAPDVSESFYTRLVLHDWPGNVREVLNVAERLFVVKPAGPWMAEDLDEILSVAPRLGLGSGVGPGVGTGVGGVAGPDPSSSHSRFEERERRELEQVLATHRWNVSAAARSLGISRGALRGRMARLGLV